MKTLNPISVDWENIQTVFLDMDGTLLDLHFDNYFWLQHMPIQYAAKHSMSINEATTQLRQFYMEMEGTLNWYCLDHWQEKLGMDIVALKHQVADKIGMRAYVIHFLEYLQKQSCRVVLLTNAHRKTINLKFGYVPIEPYFDQVITSHDIGIAKEEEGFWKRLLNTEPYDANHSLFIDDNMKVLAAAENYGIAHLLAIDQPDSRQPPANTRHYTAIECFSQLMPAPVAS